MTRAAYATLDGANSVPSVWRRPQAYEPGCSRLTYAAIRAARGQEDAGGGWGSDRTDREAGGSAASLTMSLSLGLIGPDSYFANRATILVR